MKTTVNEHDFLEAFRRYDRVDNFGLDGLRALFEYLEEYEEDTGSEMELDVIAICCDFTRYESLEEYNEAYSTSYESLDEVSEQTSVVEIEGSDAFIAHDF